MTHEENPDSTDEEHCRYDKKADPVYDAAHQEPLLVLLCWWKWEMTDQCWCKPEKTWQVKVWWREKNGINLTFWKLFCCLVVSAIRLQEATHFLSSGEALARLVLSCSAVPSSSPSSAGGKLAIDKEDTPAFAILREKPFVQGSIW